MKPAILFCASASVLNICCCCCCYFRCCWWLFCRGRLERVNMFWYVKRKREKHENERKKILGFFTRMFALDLCHCNLYSDLSGFWISNQSECVNSLCDLVLICACLRLRVSCRLRKYSLKENKRKEREIKYLSVREV